MEFYSTPFEGNENIQINEALNNLSFWEVNDCCLSFVVSKEGVLVIYRSELTEDEIKNEKVDHIDNRDYLFFGSGLMNNKILSFATITGLNYYCDWNNDLPDGREIINISPSYCEIHHLKKGLYYKNQLNIFDEDDIENIEVSYHEPKTSDRILTYKINENGCEVNDKHKVIFRDQPAHRLIKH